MTVATVKAQLVTLQKQIPGIVGAYAQLPANVDAAYPCFLNLTGPATNDFVNLGDEANIEGRIYKMQLFVLPAALGVPGEAERLCEPFFTSVPAFFNSRPSLGGLRGVQTAFILGDSGVTQLIFNDQSKPIYGIEFRLQVQEYVTFAYANTD